MTKETIVTFHVNSIVPSSEYGAWNVVLEKTLCPAEIAAQILAQAPNAELVLYLRPKKTEGDDQ